MAGAGRPISIWQPGRHDGEAAFIRPDPQPFGDHYSARRVIPARPPPGTIRVCLFGESVAAGYLYAPAVTPAQMLEELLGPQHFEVVDLSRTNERLGSMVETVEAALQLEPDALVLFGGNNWTLLETPEVSPYYDSAAARRDYGAALDAAGPMGPIELAARRKLERAVTALDRIAGIAAPAALPVVAVVPEVNLTDWEARQPVTWLPGDGAVRWHARREQVTAALSAGRWSEARRFAEEMLDLDGATGPTGFELLAAALAGAGAGGAAREAAEAAVAADHYATMGFLGAPRAGPLDQEVLRRTERHHGFAVVDLPAVMAGPGGLPGRELFLDYCHLTHRGMRVAMEPVAEAVRRAVGAPPGVGAAAPVSAPAEVEARAALGAAIHTAHRLLPVRPATGIVHHWLEAALEASPGVEDTMLDVVAARAAAAPEVLTAAQQRNLGSAYPLGFAHGWRYPHLDAVLIAAVGDVLARRSRRSRDRLDRILQAHRAVGRRPTELVDPPYHLWEPAARFHPEVTDFADVTRRPFLRCPWPSTALAFVARGRDPVRVTVTARLPRLPGGDRKGAMRIAVNGRPAGAAPLGETWATATHTVASTALQPGLNRIDLAWPAPPPVGTEMLRLAGQRLAAGHAADLHPVFAELYSVQVRTA